MIIKNLLILSLLLIASCKELDGSYTGANDVKDIADKVKEVSGVSFIEIAEDKIVLEGTADNSGNSKHLYKIKFKLPKDKSLGFYFFASKKLNDGVNVFFKRDENNDVVLNLKLNKVEHEVVLDSLKEETLDLAIEVHNDHTDAHIFIWKNGGPYSDDEFCPETGDCLFNTEYYTFPNPDPIDPGPWGEQGQASGVYWGIEGDRDLIIEVQGPLANISNA